MPLLTYGKLLVRSLFAGADDISRVYSVLQTLALMLLSASPLVLWLIGVPYALVSVAGVGPGLLIFVVGHRVWGDELRKAESRAHDIAQEREREQTKAATAIKTLQSHIDDQAAEIQLLKNPPALPALGSQLSLTAFGRNTPVYAGGPQYTCSSGVTLKNTSRLSALVVRARIVKLENLYADGDNDRWTEVRNFTPTLLRWHPEAPGVASMTLAPGTEEDLFVVLNHGGPDQDYLHWATWPEAPGKNVFYGLFPISHEYRATIRFESEFHLPAEACLEIEFKQDFGFRNLEARMVEGPR